MRRKWEDKKLISESYKKHVIYSSIIIVKNTKPWYELWETNIKNKNVIVKLFFIVIFQIEFVWQEKKHYSTFSMPPKF